MVFGPNDSLVIDSSLVLELIDYAGTGTSFGFGFDPNGSSYNFEEITLELTIESFESEVEQYTVTFASTGDASLVGHWTMDDDAANATVEDSSGNGNNGTAQQNTSVLHTAGQIGGALTFNGITDYVDCGNDNSFDITDEITISAWVKFDSLPNYQSILVKRGTQTDTASNYALRTSALANRDEVEFYYHDGSSWHVYTTSNANLTAGQWYHFVVTFTFGTGTSAKCYVNNNLLSGSWTLGNGNSPVQINTKPVTIGGLTSEERADGVIDQVKIFNKALSAAEVLELYNEPPPPEPDLLPPTPDPATFASNPTAISDTAISMTATTGSDASSPVEYYFAETSGNPGGSDSGWQPSSSYTDTGLSPSTQYTYTVQMRDGLGNTGTASDPQDATTVEPPSSDLVAHWTMDDNAGTSTVIDSSGNGNHGAAQGPTSVLHTTGAIGGALTFNGTSDYVNCGDDSSLDITDAITISAWVKFDSLPDFQSILVKRGAVTDTASNYALRTGNLANHDEVQFYYHDGSSWHVYTTSNANLTAGQWYHFVVTFTFGTGTSAKCYVNNNLLSGSWTLGNGNSPVQINTKPVTIGGLTSGERADGVIDNVMIFSRALSQEEIEELYDEGVGI